MWVCEVESQLTSKKYGIPRDREVTLAEFGDLVNHTFEFYGARRISPKTPYLWWDRYLHSAGSFPPVVRYAPSGRRGPRARRRPTPLFNAVAVVEWYAAWKQISVQPRKVRYRQERAAQTRRLAEGKADPPHPVKGRNPFL